jgi:hypothetical protein
MRRLLLVSACLTVLALGGATTALANGPHHGYGPPVARYGYPHRGGSWGGGWGGGWNSGYRGGYAPYCHSGRRVAAYPAYPAYPAAPFGYRSPQLGFGIAGRNFSFFLQQ